MRISRQPVKGEITVLIGASEPGNEAAIGAPAPLRERVEQIIREQSVDHKSALKLAARERGLTKREAYKQLLSHR